MLQGGAATCSQVLSTRAQLRPAHVSWVPGQQSAPWTKPVPRKRVGSGAGVSIHTVTAGIYLHSNHWNLNLIWEMKRPGCPTDVAAESRGLPPLPPDSGCWEDKAPDCWHLLLVGAAHLTDQSTILCPGETLPKWVRQWRTPRLCPPNILRKTLWGYLLQQVHWWRPSRAANRNLQGLVQCQSCHPL